MTLKSTIVLWTVAIMCASVAFAQRDDGAKSATSTIASNIPSTSTNGSGAEQSSGAGEDFVIGNDDVLAVNVWKEPEVSRTVPVRSDGKISLPLVGDIIATGKTPKQLQGEIAASLQTYISEPEVAVIVQEIKSKRFNILGRVARPGSYLLTAKITVLDAIAVAGGFQDFAKKKDIYVLRQNADNSQTRLAFNYKRVIKGERPEQNITLEPHDTIVVP